VQLLQILGIFSTSRGKTDIMSALLFPLPPGEREGEGHP
jgi:hypothetical protein